jgi:hypothetical protein
MNECTKYKKNIPFHTNSKTVVTVTVYKLLKINNKDGYFTEFERNLLLSMRGYVHCLDLLVIPVHQEKFFCNDT